MTTVAAPKPVGSQKMDRLVGIAYIIGGLVMVGCGFAFDAWDFLYGIIMGSMFVVGTLTLIPGIGTAKTNYLARIVVGSIFIVSGLIKANDALGFSYKLEEYFAADALGWTFFEPAALWMSILVSVGEVVLGLAVLFGGRARLAAWALLGLTVFFAWLTFYTANCDPADTYTYMAMQDGVEVEMEGTVNCVTDCGCFGDAMKGGILGRSLTPWESFKKDMFLLVYVLIFFIEQGRVKLNTRKDDLIILPASLAFIGFFAGGMFTWFFPLVFTIIVTAAYLGMKAAGGKVSNDWSIAGMATLATALFTGYCLMYLPQVDFRPYKVGSDLVKNALTCEEYNAEYPDDQQQCPVYANVYLMKNLQTGEEEKMLSTTYMQEKIYEQKDKWEMVEALDESVTLEQGYTATVQDFHIEDAEATEYTDQLMAEERLLMVVSKDLAKISDADYAKLASRAAEAEAAGFVPVLVAGGFNQEEADSIRHTHQLSFPVYKLDEITAKTVIRSNPGYVLIQNGVVKGKWSAAAAPSPDDLKAKLN